MRLRVDWIESPQVVHNRVVDLKRQVAQLPQPSPDWVANLKRQVAQLHGQLFSLLRLQQFAPRPVAPPPNFLWLRHYMPIRRSPE
ncbi:hypothetical protein PC128_g18871 [Phytophthora cactorum]|nr:hypothetical protein PC128_g18871 [Phytophthora cactorum]